MNSSNSSKKRGPDTTIKHVNYAQTWVHIKCNHLNYIDYKYLQGYN